ncbi:hypothetical protein NQ317_019256, partial [Molorchus minor]
SQCANILVIMTPPAYSSQLAYIELWRELSLRGHKVTLVTPNPINDPKLTNLTEIATKDTHRKVSNLTRFADSVVTSWNIYYYTHGVFREVSEMLHQYSKIRNLVNKSDVKSFDVVLVYFLSPEFLYLGEVYNCPTILYSSYYLHSYYYYLRGDMPHPASFADMGLQMFQPQNFQDRLLSTIYNMHIWYAKVFTEYPEREEIIQRYSKRKVNVEQLIRNVDLLFVNTNPVIHGARSLNPTTIEIGYERKLLHPEILDKDLKSFMDSSRDGFIYFSLGSTLKSKDLNKQFIKTIVEILAEIPLKIIFKYEADDLTDMARNILFVKWAPQYTILRHPNIKLFITQGGFHSMEEAIYSGVPMIAIPIFIDQKYNGQIMEAKGIGKIVNKMTVKMDLRSAIMDILNNSRTLKIISGSYKDNILKLRKLASDVPMNGLEKAIWWIEYVIRNKGAKHLRNPTSDLPFYQYAHLDVIAFLVLTVTVCLSIIIVSIRKLHKIIVQSTNKNKKE